MTPVGEYCVVGSQNLWEALFNCSIFNMNYLVAPEDHVVHLFCQVSLWSIWAPLWGYREAAGPELTKAAQAFRNTLPYFTYSTKSKKSADWNDMDKYLIRNIIECEGKPLSYICNLSLHAVLLPSKMKRVEVIPIGLEIDMYFLIMSPFLWTHSFRKYCKNYFIQD